MDQNKSLKIVFNPERDTAKATRASKVLMEIVKQNNWAKKFGGEKEHIFYEGWQTLAKYYNISIATGDAEPVTIGEVSGFKAKAWAVDNKTGVRVGEAEAYCMRDEPNWKSKPTFQLASMAQTRAGSKALRQMFGFVVALAGYNPTPAEEMTGEENQTNSEYPASDKQKEFIVRLLSQKGHSQAELAKKYGPVENLSKDKASTIIEKLMTLPDAIAATEELKVEGIQEAQEVEVNPDEIPDNL